MESLVEATSGAVGALVSTTVLYPLDTCKTKYQAENRAHHHQKYRFLFSFFWYASPFDVSFFFFPFLVNSVANYACDALFFTMPFIAWYFPFQILLFLLFFVTHKYINEHCISNKRSKSNWNSYSKYWKVLDIWFPVTFRIILLD